MSGARRVGSASPGAARRLADRLLRRCIARPVVAASIIGDLHEEHAALRRRRGPASAALWYAIQALRIAARYRFGRPEGSGGASDPPHRTALLEDLRRDVRGATRALRRNPLPAGAIVLSLALAIGANATMFGVIDRLLLSPPAHIADAADVVRLHVEVTGPGEQPFLMQSTSYPVYEDLRGGTRSFAGWAAIAPREAVLGSGEAAEPVAASAVSGGYFALLGTRPRLGRLLDETDDRAPVGSPVAVISHRLWQRRFGGDADALGARLLVDGTAVTVVGVAPAGFTGDGLEPIEVWLPLHHGMAREGTAWKHDRRWRLVSVIGRRAGDAAAAQADADSALRNGAEAAGERAGLRAVLGPLTPGRGPQGTSTEGRISLWLGGVALVVLLVAISNVSNLLLLRAQQRHRELAVCLALGMGRGRLVRQSLTETAVLAVLGGIGALLLSSWTGELLRIFLMPNTAPAAAALSARVAMITVLATMIAMVLAGLLPALHLARFAAAPAAPARRAEGPARARLRGLLLMAQTAMSVVLLVGAGLFVTSLRNVQSQDLGLRLDDVLLAEIRFNGDVAGADRDALYRDALVRVHRIPGVDTAVVAQAIPFGAFMTLQIGFPGKDFRALFEGRQVPYFHAVEPEFFDLMGIDIVAGRALRPTDDAAAPPATVISESLARHVWPDEQALGKCMYAGMNSLPGPGAYLEGAGDDVPCYEIVGIAADVNERSLLPEYRLSMQWYTTFEQFPPTPPMMADARWAWALLVKAGGDRQAVAGEVRRIMQGVSARIAYVDVRPYRELIDPRTRSWRLGATLFSVFGGLALAIATVGMYAVFAFAAGQRTGEMGVRMALGARRADVARLIVGRSVGTVLAGVAVGSVVSLWAARYVEDLLFGTGAWNPPVLGAVVGLLIAVAALASALPAWRATRTDPKVTLASG